MEIKSFVPVLLSADEIHAIIHRTWQHLSQDELDNLMDKLEDALALLSE